MARDRNIFGYERELAWRDMYDRHEVEPSGESDFRGFRELLEERGIRGYDKGEKQFGPPDAEREYGRKFSYPEEPQDKLDLHGQKVEEALKALRKFVQESRERRLDFVIVVPGIGRNSPEGKAKLRPMAVAELLKLQEKHLIRRFETAEVRHGGAGAIYVYIR